MKTAKKIENGRSQAVRLPKKFRFTSNEVVVHRLGSSLILTPKDKIWESFMNGINGFTEDFFEDGRYGSTPPDERDGL